MQALRAANNAGIYVPRSVIDHSLTYIRSLVYVREEARRQSNNIFPQQSGNHTENDGGFYYQEMGRDGHPERVTFAICAAGVTALNGTGIYEGKALDNGYQFLKRRYLYNSFPHLQRTEGYAINLYGMFKERGRKLPPKVQNFQFFYGHYYAVVAHFHDNFVHLDF